MKYDLEIVVPMSSKFKERIEDFKRYGTFNAGDSKVLVTPIVSGEEIEKLESGWNGLEAKPVIYESGDFVANTYRYFLEREPESRWIIKLDDDSCTDIKGIISNLDKFYSSDDKIYLANSLNRFVFGKEFELRELYERFFGDSFIHFSHEIEMSVLSHVAFKLIKSTANSKDFLEQRCNLTGGATDLALAYAAILAKVPIVNFPFSTDRPSLDQFSLFGGHLNHIHLVSRELIGDNFQEWERCGKIQFLALTKAIDGTMSETESKMAGKKFLFENERELVLYEFKKNRTARVKFDERVYLWTEHEGKIFMFHDPREIHRVFSVDEVGKLSWKEEDGQEFTLNPL